MPALELLTGFATAPGTTYTGLTMAAQNSLTVRNCDESKKITLLNFWTDSQGQGNFRVRSPRLHDNVQGINVETVISQPLPLLPEGLGQTLIPQDTLVAEITGSATAGDIETACILVHYEDLPGVSARLIDTATLKSRAVNQMGNLNTLALGTAGGYSGAVAINATTDLMKANTDYALVGYQVSAECACVRWTGADTGNVGVGGPGIPDFNHITGNWFSRLSDMYGKPLIPVFNSANKAGIIIDGAQDENGTDVIVSSIFVQLSPA